MIHGMAFWVKTPSPFNRQADSIIRIHYFDLMGNIKSGSDFSQLLQSQQTQDLSGDLHDHACVAIILRGKSFESLEVGFIQRAIQPNDKWSGQIAFPGGRREPQDTDDISVAQRETWEEIGVQLLRDEFIGRIDDIQGRKAGLLLPFYIRPIVFHIEREFVLNLQPSEVSDFFWVPLATLLNPQSQITYKLQRELIAVELPGINLDRDVPLWGLTYMMIQDLLKRLQKNVS